MISRIENNQSAPTDYNLQGICHILNMPINEYFDTKFGKKKTHLARVKSVLEQAYISQDNHALQYMYNVAREKAITEPDNLTRRHFFLMTKSTLYHLDYKLTTTSVQHELIDYFFAVELWHYYDLCLFLFAQNIINVEKLKPYINDILNQYLDNKLSTVSDNMMAPILISFLESTIVQQKNALTKSLFLRIHNLNLFEENMTFQTCLLFLSGLFENNHTKINTAYDIITALNLTRYQKLFDHLRDYYQQLNTI